MEMKMKRETVAFSLGALTAGILIVIRVRQNIQTLIADDNVTEEAKVVLVLLYALRYEKAPNNSIKTLVDLLDRYGVSEHASSVRTH
jgi:hypothetical protein